MATADDDPDDRLSPDDLLWLVREMPDSLSTVAMLLADCEQREIVATPAELYGLLAGAVAAGLVVAWDFDGEPWFTLTPVAAEAMGVRLAPDSSRWLPESVLVTERLGPRPGFTRADMDPSIYIDPASPEPIDVLIAAEETQFGPGKNKLRDGSSVLVDLVLGIGMAWPVADVTLGDGTRACGICRGHVARRNAYCPKCHRAGVDGLLPPIEPDLKPGGKKPTKPKPSKLAACTAPAVTAPPPGGRRRKGARGAA